MPRGGHKVKSVKPAKVAQVDASAPSTVKPTRTTTDWRAVIPTPTFLSRNLPETRPVGPISVQPPIVREPSREQDVTAGSLARKQSLPVNSAPIRTVSEGAEGHDATSSGLPTEEDETYETVLDTFEDLAIEETRSIASSSYSRDSLSIYSSDTASVYSSASSVYSSGASIFSFDEGESKDFDRYGGKGSTELNIKQTDVTSNSRLPGGLQYQQRARTVATRQLAPQDAASRERSTLAKKAALFKNSRLKPQLPTFGTSLPTWSLVCRAVQASRDCYDSQSRTRRGIYTPANSSKDIKAMIIDEQLIDESRFVIISIRGTEFQSLADWAVNKAANPAKPVGFLDDEENLCHAGFLQVAKAMMGQVALQLKQHPASSENPSLLFTGHSAGGAVAALLYTHMLSTSVQSDLTALASQFPSINCLTFGAPPLSLTPMPRIDRGSGVFLAFANEGDPVVRLSNAAYVKSLAKLMTASTPSAVAPVAPVKVVRRSRGGAVIRQTAVPATPWEDLPLWPTPPTPLTNAGDIILLRDKENGSAAASRVTSEDLTDVIFGDLAQHSIQMYIRRVQEVSFATMIGKASS